MSEEITAEDERAIGHGILFFLKKPSVIISLAIALATGTVALVKSDAGTATVKTDTLVLEKIEIIGNDVVEIKVNQSAILNSLPESQRKKAQAQIELQMQALRMWKAKQ